MKCKYGNLKSKKKGRKCLSRRGAHNKVIAKYNKRHGIRSKSRKKSRRKKSKRKKSKSKSKKRKGFFAGLFGR